MRPFEKAQSKIMRAYAQSGQYHTIMESRVRLTTLKQKFAPFFFLYGINSIWVNLNSVPKKLTQPNFYDSD